MITLLLTNGLVALPGQQEIANQPTEMSRYQKILMEIAGKEVMEIGDKKVFFSRVSELVVEGMDASRVGVWEFDESSQHLSCACEEIREDIPNREGKAFLIADHPEYFSKIQQNRVVWIEKELQGTQLSQKFPKRIVLDAPLRSSGEVVGLISVEWLHGIEERSRSDEGFISSVADLISLYLEIHRRKLSEWIMESARDFLIQQNRVVQQLTKSDSLNQGHVENFFALTAKEACTLLEADRVGIFLLAPRSDELVCESLYLKEKGFIKRENFSFKASPSYQNALQNNRVIEILAAHENPLTAENQSTYTADDPRRSCLDASFRLNGNLAGVISIVSETRKESWGHEAHQFIASVTDLLSLCLEIAQRRKTESALRVSERRNRALVKAMPDLIFLLDPDGMVLDCRGGRTIELDIHPEDLVGQNIRDFLPREFAGEIQEMIQKTILGNELHTLETEVEFPSGSKFLEIRFIGVGEDRILAMERNITDRKKAELELIERNLELDSFVYKASHDLKAPLNSIMGLLDLIRPKAQDDLLPFLQMIDKSVNKLNRFIRNLNDFSRVARLNVRNESLDLKQLVEEVFEGLQYLEGIERISLKMDVDAPDEFHSDELHLQIILSNLVSNAIKYLDHSKPEARVTVTIRTSDNGVVIRVEDNGIGIAKEHQNRIFQLFFRATVQSSGSGLGLYITRNAVKLLGGNIRFESEEGKGTSFIVELPDLETSAEPAEENKAEELER